MNNGFPLISNVKTETLLQHRVTKTAPKHALFRWGISAPWSAHPGPAQDLWHCSVSWGNSLSDSVEMPQFLGEHSHILSTVIRHEGHPYVHFNGQVPLTLHWLADSGGSYCEHKQTRCEGKRPFSVLKLATGDLARSPPTYFYLMGKHNYLFFWSRTLGQELRW